MSSPDSSADAAARPEDAALALPAPYRHLIEDIAIVLLRIAALWFVAVSISVMILKLTAMLAVPAEQRDLLLAELFPQAAFLLVGVALWFGAPVFARFFVGGRAAQRAASSDAAHAYAEKPRTGPRDTAPFARQLFVAGVAIVGLSFIANGVVGFVNWAVFVSSLPDDFGPLHPGFGVSLPAPLVEIAIGMLLLFGGRGIIRLLRRSGAKIAQLFDDDRRDDTWNLPEPRE